MVYGTVSSKGGRGERLASDEVIEGNRTSSRPKVAVQFFKFGAVKRAMKRPCEGQ
jgi:hypothetical protein